MKINLNLNIFLLLKFHNLDLKTRVKIGHLKMRPFFSGRSKYLLPSITLVGAAVAFGVAEVADETLVAAVAAPMAVSKAHLSDFLSNLPLAEVELARPASASIRNFVKSSAAGRESRNRPGTSGLRSGSRFRCC